MLTKNIKFLVRIRLFEFAKMLNQVCGNMSVLSRVQLILSPDLFRQVYVVEILCGRKVQKFYSNLGNNLLNKIYVYENRDSFKKVII